MSSNQIRVLSIVTWQIMVFSCVILMVLNLLDVIDVSLAVVFAPLWVPVVLGSIFIMVLIWVYGLACMLIKYQETKRGKESEDDR